MSEPKRVTITCPKCGRDREVTLSNLKARVSMLCKNCYMSKHLIRIHEKKRNRPMSERPQTKRSDGYLEMSLPSWHWCYPMASKTRHSIIVHRLVMAEHLERLLNKGEIVHHINGIKDDNRIENLQLVTLGSHKLSYEEGFRRGFKVGAESRDDGLKKEIKLLQWNIKELRESLQLKFGV